MSEPLAVVLAAGKGSRMNSDLPKVLIQVAGRPMLEYVLDALEQGGVGRMVVVVGHRADLVREALNGRSNVDFATQHEQLGTGHAVMAAREHLERHDGPVVVVAGDSPLMQADSIRELLREFDEEPCSCLLGTVTKENPTGLGRILRNAEGEFIGIVEEKDASDDQRQITEVNMSYYVFDCHPLLDALKFIRNDNAQGEYYITDCPGVMSNQDRLVRAVNVLKPCEALGVNTPDELAAADRMLNGDE